MEGGRISEMNVARFLEEIIPIKDKELKEKLEHVCRVDVFERGEHINEVGERDYYVRFIIHGLVRSYIIDSRGKEITTAYGRIPGEPISGTRLLDGSVSDIAFQAMARTEVFSIPVEAVMGLKMQYQEISDIYINVLTYCLAEHWDLRKMQYMHSARERYEWFLKKYPGLIDIVSHAQIASLLDITPVTLSRVRHSEEK